MYTKESRESYWQFLKAWKEMVRNTDAAKALAEHLMQEAGLLQQSKKFIAQARRVHNRIIDKWMLVEHASVEEMSVENAAMPSVFSEGEGVYALLQQRRQLIDQALETVKNDALREKLRPFVYAVQLRMVVIHLESMGSLSPAQAKDVHVYFREQAVIALDQMRLKQSQTWTDSLPPSPLFQPENQSCDRARE